MAGGDRDGRDGAGPVMAQTWMGRAAPDQPQGLGHKHSGPHSLLSTDPTGDDPAR